MIKDATEPVSKRMYGTVKGGKLNIRKEPHISSEIVGVLEEGQRVQIKEVGEIWHKTAKGYVMAEYVQMGE